MYYNHPSTTLSVTVRLSVFEGWFYYLKDIECTYIIFKTRIPVSCVLIG